MISSGVIFDMDGLLLDTEKVCLDCFVETRRAYDLSASPEVFLRTVGLRGKESDQIIIESLNGEVGFKDFSREWDRRIAASLKHDIPVKAGALKLLKKLKQKGHPMAVATSTRTDTARKHLEKADLLGFFDIVVGGDQVKKGKPDPEVYLKAASRIGYPATSCYAFEDSETGVKAAHASGAKTIQIPDLIEPSSNLKSLGHLIAPSLLKGAIMAGMICEADA